MPAAKDVCFIDGNCDDDYTNYIIIAVLAIIIIGSLIYYNYNKQQSNKEIDTHVHGECEGDKCYM
jgi:hypothetical protein